MENNELASVLELSFWLTIFVIWIYSKYVVIKSLYKQKYQDKIDYLKSISLYYPLWKYMEMNQVVFRMLLKGKIK